MSWCTPFSGRLIWPQWTSWKLLARMIYPPANLPARRCSVPLSLSRSNWRQLCSGHRAVPVWTVLEQEAAQRANGSFGDVIMASLSSDLG